MIDPQSWLGRLFRRIGSHPFGRVVLGPHVVRRLDAVARRLTGGRWRPSDLLFDTIELTTVGRRSGQPRAIALAAFEVDGELAVIASNFGRPSHPAWSHNLLAHSEATVNRRGEQHRVRARVLEGDERARAWATAVAIWPGYDAYREVIDDDRDIRVFRLERLDDGTAVEDVGR